MQVILCVLLTVVIPDLKRQKRLLPLPADLCALLLWIIGHNWLVNVSWLWARNPGSMG